MGFLESRKRERRSGPILALLSASRRLALMTELANSFMTLQFLEMRRSASVRPKLRFKHQKGSWKRFWERFWTS